MGPSGQWGAESHVAGLGHGGDLLDLGQAAGMGQVRLDDVHAAGAQQTLEVPAGVKPLAGGNGDVAGCGDFREVLHVLAQNGLLQEHGIKFLQLLGQNLGHGLVDPAVEVDGDAEVLAAGFPDAGHPLQDLVDLGIGVDELQFFRGVHLDAR